MSGFDIFSLDIRVKVKYQGERLRSFLRSMVKVKVWGQGQMFGAKWVILGNTHETQVQDHLPLRVHGLCVCDQLFSRYVVH